MASPRFKTATFEERTFWDMVYARRVADRETSTFSAALTADRALEDRRERFGRAGEEIAVAKVESRFDRLG